MKLHQAAPAVDYRVVSIPDELSQSLHIQVNDIVQYDGQRGLYANEEYHPLELWKCEQIDIEQKENERSLADLKPGMVGIITHIEGKEMVRRRLLDMGFTQGTQVKVLKEAPLKDPVEFELRGYSLTLRKSEAEKIYIQSAEGENQ